MKTIIAGSRGINDYRLVCQAIMESKFNITTVLSGTANGVDKLGELWADRHSTPIERYTPDWAKNGRSAGIKRNIEMAQDADALVAIWDGKSKGTQHMIRIAKQMGLKVYVKEQY